MKKEITFVPKKKTLKFFFVFCIFSSFCCCKFVMENHGDDPNSPNQGCERAEPVRSRWTPKPEQILILESIFNSGMVNPPKDETVRIRKLLEKFGSVGDANVFYWFQNRRSRSRRRQRQLQAAATHQGSTGAIHYDCGNVSSGGYNGGSGGIMNFAGVSSSYLGGGSSSSSSSASGVGGDCSGGSGGSSGFSMSGHMGFSEVDQQMVVTSTPSFCPSETSNLEFQSGTVNACFSSTKKKKKKTSSFRCLN